jgi:hypothetical protein
MINGIEDHIDLPTIDTALGQMVPRHSGYGQYFFWKHPPEKGDAFDQERAEITWRKDVMKPPYQRD